MDERKNLAERGGDPLEMVASRCSVADTDIGGDVVKVVPGTRSVSDDDAAAVTAAVAPFPVSPDTISTETLAGILCRPGTDLHGFQVVGFDVDNELMGGAGNSFAGSLVGAAVALRRGSGSGGSSATDSSGDVSNDGSSGRNSGNNNGGGGGMDDDVSDDCDDDDDDKACNGNDDENCNGGSKDCDADDGNDAEIKVYLALKFPPRNAQQRRMLCEWFQFFPREVEIYTIYFPAVEAFLEERNAELLDAWRALLPKCFFAVAETSARFDACIAVEDLRFSGKGYHARRLLEGADEADCVAILRQLAFYHAVSACFLADNPDFMEERLRFANADPFAGEGAEGLKRRAGYTQSLSHVFRLTKATGQLTQDEERLFQSVLDDVLGSHNRDAYKESRGPRVINHGDFTLSNVMMTADGEIKFIDFQISQAGDLLVDLILFLYTTLRDAGDRRRLLPGLLAAFHAEFLAVVARLGFAGRVSYPRPDFAADFADKCRTFGVPRVGFALFLNSAERADFEAAGAGGNVLTILAAVGARADRGELDGGKARVVTAAMLELLRMRPEHVTA